VQKFFVPPRDSADWSRVSYQPMLYLGLFTGTLIVLVWGDFATVPQHNLDREYGLFWIWGGLSTVCPVLALGSLHLIQNRTGRQRYRGLWLRLGADVGQFTAMGLYLWLRLVWGDYHIMPISVFASATLFVLHLCFRDIHRLVEVERLATQIHRDGTDE
jgi:hypothetical protein